MRMADPTKVTGKMGKSMVLGNFITSLATWPTRGIGKRVNFMERARFLMKVPSQFLEHTIIQISQILELPGSGMKENFKTITNMGRVV